MFPSSYSSMLSWIILLSMGVSIAVAASEAAAPPPFDCFDWRVFFNKPVLPAQWSHGKLVLLALAVFTLMAAVHRSGFERFKTIQKAHTSPEDCVDRYCNTGVRTSCAIFIVMMILLLVYSYFLYEPAVITLTVLVAMGGTFGLFLILFGRQTEQEDREMEKSPLSSAVWVLLALAFSVADTVVWLVFRTHPFGWFFHLDTALYFATYYIIAVKLPSFKVGTLLLLLAVVYDVCANFINIGGTTLEEVISRGRSSDSPKEVYVSFLNAVFRPSPYRNPWFMSIIEINQESFDKRGFDYLGVGDIIFPGLWMSYLRVFELVNGLGPIYWAAGTIGYTVAFLMADVVTYLTGVHQPKLLYIVPTLLAVTFGIALFRREFASLFSFRMSAMKPEPAGEKTDVESSPDSPPPSYSVLELEAICSKTESSLDHC